ncbi:D-alanyl-D-alanine carboxypeptidase family protein [Streptomyces cyaneofuscatus]|uniref:D-alanyl-D-alanine carboxypeptidase family protein n=1 Tax=Streptomyces cyaneofuscatus TaxID=66883 RepID=UPI0036A91C58
MAGESPDKTEQRKSSGTAAEERDPRFAVFREPGADVAEDAAADEATTDGVTTDTATAVFRPRLPEDEAGRAPERSASGPEEPASGEEEPAKAPEGAVTPQKPAEGSDEGAEAPEGADAAAEASEGDADDAGDTSDAGVGEPEPGDVRLRAAVAAWVDAAAEGEAKTDGETDDKADDSADSAKGEVEAKGGPAADADAEPAADSDSDSAPEAEAETELKSAEKPEAEPAEEPEPEAEAETATAAAEAEKAESAADADADADAESTSDAEPDSDSKSDSKSDADGEGPAPDADAATGSDLRGIDQPTAVFKAVAPPKRVDQPTTALKLSPQEREELKAAGDKAREPESAVERTSTFVPLRSDDVRPAPAPRAPETEAPTGKPDAGPATPTPASTPSPSPTPAPAAPSWAAAERTRQQPLPPKPPLDLLAELTNTPPPAETPVRTAVRRVKIWTPLVLLLLIVFAIVQVMRPLPEPALELTAKPTYTFEGGETKLSWPGQGQSAVMVDGVGSLGSEGAQKPAPIASVAKAMTAYVILQEHPLKGDEVGETITVDQQAEDESKNEDESVAQLTSGQKLSQLQLLQLLMIPSGNNAARLLARWDSGSEDKFVEKMNEAAEDLGMADSTYTDPSGLKKTTVSTATDQLKLAQAVMRSEVFRKIVDMPDIEIEGMPGKIYNNNTLLLQPGVSGIKTGSSTPAGGNLLWSANTVVDGKTLWIYGAVMGQQAGTGVHHSLELSLANSLKLIKDAQKAPTSATVVKKGDVVGYVDNGFGAQTPVIATKNLKAVGWPGLKVELKVTDNGKGIAHAAKAGSEVGMVTVGTGTGKVTAPVVLQGDLTEPAFGDKLTRIG